MDLVPIYENYLPGKSAQSTDLILNLYLEGSIKSIPIMKEALVNKDVSVEIVDSPIPKPGPGQLLIKVVVAGTY